MVAFTRWQGVRAVAQWQLIASALRAEIQRGLHAPGSVLPKEAELQQRFNVSRQPVRRAIAQLTAEGLVVPVRRRGTVVREHPIRRRVTRSRTVYRDEIGYYFDSAAQGWRALRPPTVKRGPAPGDVAHLLAVEPGAEVVIRDRVMGDPTSSEPTQLATSYLPADLVAELPVLAQYDTGHGGIYDRIEEAGYGPLAWHEMITARMPTPDEADLLYLPPGVPVLRIIRTASTPSGRVVEVNDTRMNAEAWEAGYSIDRDLSALPREEPGMGK